MGKKKFRKRKFAVFLIVELVLLALGAGLYFSDRAWWGVKVAGMAVGGERFAEIEEMLVVKARENLANPIIIEMGGGGKIAKKIGELGVEYDVGETMVRVKGVDGRSGGWERQMAARLKMLGGAKVEWVYRVGRGAENLVDQVVQSVNTPAVEPGYTITGKGKEKKVVVAAGSGGVEVDRNRLTEMVANAIRDGKGGVIEVPVLMISPQLDEEEVVRNQERANNLVASSIRLKLVEDASGSRDQEWTIEGEELVAFMAFPAGFDEAKIASWSANLAGVVNRDAQNAMFNFVAGRVEEFREAKDGLRLEERALVENLLRILEKLETAPGGENSLLPMSRTKPEVTTEEVNRLGIKELVGIGRSKFHGSIANRVHNLTLAASRINGVLVPPGSEFSFNNTVGEISRATGYKEAYVIEKGRTVLGDGGGVCQVSTTLFRSVLNAGLNVTERKAHAYRVHYYEEDSKPGIDATVFAPSVDLRFVNDTPAYILIQAKVDKKNMAMEVALYGTRDGRVATITTPKISGQTPPPPDLYQDDPTLPVGVVKQVDWSAWGARVSFGYRVVRREEVLIDRVFSSNYKSWQAVYLRGVRI